MSEDTKKPAQESAELVRLRPKRPCPICSKSSKQKYHPFCSARCADIDLHRWLGERYKVPAAEQPDFEDATALQDNAEQDRTER